MSHKTINRVLAIAGVSLLGGVIFLLTPASRDEISWRQAAHKDHPESYARYLRAWPEGRHVQEAARRRDELHWIRARTAGGVSDYAYYTQLHSNGIHTAEARDAIDTLRWQTAQAGNTVEGFKTYLDENPEGKRLQEARDAIDALHWQAATRTNTIQGFETYARMAPDGKYIADAKVHIEQLVWDAARQRNTAKSLGEYLDSYPEGRYAREAQTRRAECLRDEEPYRLALAAGTTNAYRQFISDYPGHACLGKSHVLVLTGKMELEGFSNRIDDDGHVARNTPINWESAGIESTFQQGALAQGGSFWFFLPEPSLSVSRNGTEVRGPHKGSLHCFAMESGAFLRKIPLPEGLSVGTGLAVRSDGRQVAIVSGTYVTIADLVDGTLHKVAGIDLSDYSCNTLAFSPQGHHILCANGKQFMIIDVAQKAILQRHKINDLVRKTDPDIGQPRTFTVEGAPEVMQANFTLARALLLDENMTALIVFERFLSGPKHYRAGTDQYVWSFNLKTGEACVLEKTVHVAVNSMDRSPKGLHVLIQRGNHGEHFIKF